MYRYIYICIYDVYIVYIQVWTICLKQPLRPLSPFEAATSLEEGHCFIPSAYQTLLILFPSHSIFLFFLLTYFTQPSEFLIVSYSNTPFTPALPLYSQQFTPSRVAPILRKSRRRRCRRRRQRRGALQHHRQGLDAAASLRPIGFLSAFLARSTGCGSQRRRARSSAAATTPHPSATSTHHLVPIVLQLNDAASISYRLRYNRLVFRYGRSMHFFSVRLGFFFICLLLFFFLSFSPKYFGKPEKPPRAVV